MQITDDLISGDLKISAIAEDGTKAISCTWTGRSTDRHPSKILNPWFDKLLGQASKEQYAVFMHFETLEHFNSSTIGAIVQLIKTARDREVPLKLVYSSKHRWQRISFEALRVFDRNDKFFTLETV